MKIYLLKPRKEARIKLSFVYGKGEEMAEESSDQPQYLYLEGDQEGKKWVAEIIDEDPTFRLKKMFLPEIKTNTFAIYDGVYQIYGQHPGITPFVKEYCQVKKGHMQRRLAFYQVVNQLPVIKAAEPLRVQHFKEQIFLQLDEIANQCDHDLVREDIQYLKEQVDDVSDSQSLNGGLAQLLKNKERMIVDYQMKIEKYDQ